MTDDDKQSSSDLERGRTTNVFAKKHYHPAEAVSTMSHSTVASLRQADSTTTHKTTTTPSLTMNTVDTEMEAMYTDLFADVVPPSFPFFGASHASILAALEKDGDSGGGGGLVLSPKDDLVSSTTSVTSDEPWASPASASIMSPKCYQDMDIVKPMTDLPSSPKTYKDLDAPSTPPSTNLQPVSQEFSLSGLQEIDNMYTLTLTDGTIVQLQVTKEDEDTSPKPTLKEEASDGSWLQPQQQAQDFDSMFQTLLQAEDSHSSCSSTPSSPAAAAAAAVSPLPPVKKTRKRPAAAEPRRPQPIRKNPKRSSARSCSESGLSYSSAASTASSFDSQEFDDLDGSYDELLNMFTSCQHVTIESLKAKLSGSAGPDGCADLGALLVAAKVDLTLNDIVGPPLNTVKKTMIVKGLSDWQQTLCLKIRRRKKNTAAVRSSRRKRNQYVQNLREHVTDLKKRKHDGMVQNKLLKQLATLWQHLIAEVEEEIKAAGVTVSGPSQQQLPRPDSSSTLPNIPSPLAPIDTAAEAALPAHRQLESKRVIKRRQSKSNSPLVFVVLPPQQQQLNDEIDREAKSPTIKSLAAAAGQEDRDEYELQLEDEVVPVILTNASREDEEAYNNGRNFIKIAPRQQQRIFLLKTPDAKGV